MHSVGVVLHAIGIYIQRSVNPSGVGMHAMQRNVNLVTTVCSGKKISESSSIFPARHPLSRTCLKGPRVSNDDFSHRWDLCGPPYLLGLPVWR